MIEVSAPTPARSPLVDVKAAAAYLSVSPDWVYSHADELGARRLGSGPKARLRFSLAEVDERLCACLEDRGAPSPVPAQQRASRARRGRALGTNVELLPIRGDQRAA